MTTHPALHTRPASFADSMNAEPGTSTGTFKLALSGPDGVQLGWLGCDGSGYAVLVADENKAVTLESYPHENSTYYRILGTKRWMSVSNQDYVGFYEVLGWLQATPFTKDDSGHLISQYNHQKLSLYSKDDGYLYCWNDYTVLTVRFVS